MRVKSFPYLVSNLLRYIEIYIYINTYINRIGSDSRKRANHMPEKNVGHKRVSEVSKFPFEDSLFLILSIRSRFRDSYFGPLFFPCPCKIELTIKFWLIWQWNSRRPVTDLSKPIEIADLDNRRGMIRCRTRAVLANSHSTEGEEPPRKGGQGVASPDPSAPSGISEEG